MPFPPKPSRPPSFSPLWKKPAKMIAAWPPPEAAGFYDVTDTDNWGTVAARKNLPDPWDLIIFNFRTDKPEEVNWYLHHLVGCIHSNDGKNFTFRGAEFRRIYIPPDGWIPDEDYSKGSFNYRYLAKSVARDLAAIVPNLKAVMYNGIAVTPFQFREIREDVISSRLAVKLDPSLPNPQFEHSPPTVFLTHYKPGDYNGKMSLIHELTHAIVAREGRRIRVLDGEMLARSLEAIYLFATQAARIEANMKTIAARLKSGSSAYMPYFFLGWVIWKHFRNDSFINLRKLDTTFEDPFRGINANPVLLMEAFVVLNPGYMFKWWRVY